MKMLNKRNTKIETPNMKIKNKKNIKKRKKR